VVVTNGPAPTGVVPDSLYAYGQFGGYWSFGCRYKPTRDPVCALYSPRPGMLSGPFATDAGRVWEMSNFQHVGQTTGGFPSGGLANLWRTCDGVDPDTFCRDRFRLELTKTSVTIYVNGGLYFSETNLSVPFPDDFLNNPVYTYFAGWEVRQTAPTIRFHWDYLAVNPSTGPSAAPGFGGAPPATVTPTPIPATPTPLPTGACAPRPNVVISTVKQAPGTLQVTLTAGTSSILTSNALRQVQFGVAANARIDAGGQVGRPGSFTVSLPSSARQFTFTVRRATEGAATTVPLTVVDACGNWSSFVGGGPTAF
jgi:hypothetical protein